MTHSEMLVAISKLNDMTGKRVLSEPNGFCLPCRRRIRFEVKQAMKAEGFELVENDYDDGDRPCQYWYDIKLISDDKNSQTIKTQHAA